MKHSTARRSLVLLVAATALIAAACGGGDSSKEGDEKTSATPAGAVTSLDDVKIATVQILGEGEIRTFEGSTNFSGTGSGFVVSPDGYIVTNNHVVTGAGSLQVRLDGVEDEIPAKVIGVSECNDLAVIQLTDEDDYRFLTWSSKTPEPPLEVYAAGFPLGDPEFTITKGIVSKADADGDTSWASVRSVVEHDANIQPGNSGGPLVDTKGQVVAVNYSNGDAGTGTSQFFAINAEDAQEVVEDLKKGDQDSIGVNGEAFVDEEAGVAGVWVSGVAPGGLAAKAGVKPGDIITTLNGVPLESGTLNEYCDVLRSNDLTDAISLRVVRLDTEEVLEGELNGPELEATFSFASELGGDLEGGGGGEAPSSEFTEVTDDTGSIVMSVPSNWSDVSTEPQDLLGDGTPSPAIVAAPDQAAFLSDTGPGVLLAYLQDVGQFALDDLLDSGVADSDCTEASRSDYADGVFTGRFVELDCNGVVGLLLVANPDDDPESIMLVAGAATTEADLRAIDQILSSFNLT
jgi:serine protease Do